MGRILEILSRPISRQATAMPASRAPSVEAHPETEIPYIEVGGPRREIDASPSVRAAAHRIPNGNAAPPAETPSADTSHAMAGIAYKPNSADAKLGPASSRFAPQLIAFHEPHHPVSEQYRAVLSGMTTRRLGKDAPIHLLVSPISGVGATTAALNLAISRAAYAEGRSLVIDGNLRRPAITARLGLEASPGLREVTRQTVPLSRALQESGQPGLWVLGAGEPVVAGTPWPMAEALHTVLNQLRSHFDWILVDGPSWDGGPEMVSWAAAADAIFLVVRPDMVATPVVHELAKLIPPLGTHLGGYIVTQR